MLSQLQSHCHYCIYGANEAVVVYPISVLDIHVIHLFFVTLHIKIWYSQPGNTPIHPFPLFMHG